MATEFTPYINRAPGDLVSASDWNNMQVEIKKDMAEKIKQAVDEKVSIEHADDSDRLENKTAKELSDEIVETALRQVAKRTGYMLLFKRLVPGETSLIEHNLKAFPLVDIYALSPFPVVYTEDGDDKVEGQAYFYLYNADLEQRLRATPGGTSVEIERSGDGEMQFKIRWSELLSLYNVDYDDKSSLSNLEGEFWTTLFSKPNDRFDDDDYFHSPWFSRCCGEGRTVYQLKSKREFDDLYLKMVATKSVNTPANTELTLGVPHVVVSHFSFDRLGLTYMGGTAARPGRNPGANELVDVKPTPGDARVMVLLKV
ncbi:MAG TPA: hypothetical protein VGV59_12430 [Pyrinomonadaceae bacterium]|nr:hypothetical protein [Pyrinomonadaceae bacterium]